MKNQQEIIGRIKSHVKETNGCWLWTGATAGNGYPVMRILGKIYSVRRLVYKLYNRKPKQGNQALRAKPCNRSDCVNPNHLHVDSRRKGGRPKES